jgi:hypothetical protein
MKSTKSKKPRPPLVVRHEPPTIDEAIAAARDLADDLPQQVAIVAGLMGLSEEEVREQVAAAPPPRPTIRASTRFAGTDRPVVVVRRASRFADQRPRLVGSR